MIKYKINLKNKREFTTFLKDIKNIFNNNNNSIHNARNEIKVINYQNTNLIVKSFKIPHLLNRIIYTTFRDSKAKKSYNNSLKIQIFVPKAIGYIEFYKSGLLEKSYFVSEHFNYDFTIREPLLNDNFPQKKEILKAFAKFTFELHENKILHQDYSPGNILIKKENDKFVFKIVDINRMLFKNLSLDERLKNFSKLWAKNKDIKIIIETYAKLISENEEKCLTKALYYSQKNKNFKNFKKRLKGKRVND